MCVKKISLNNPEAETLGSETPNFRYDNVKSRGRYASF
jgi:hypothetical protein